MSNAIILENQNTGTTAWQITTPAYTHLQCYVSKSSVTQGDTINFHVSSDATTYSILVYRMGYYGGAGGRLMTTISGLTSLNQGYFDSAAKTLNNTPTTTTDPTTGLCEAMWSSTYTLTIPGNWITGVYLCVVQDNFGRQWYTKFIVRAAGGEDYAVSIGDLTWAAYNYWGGKSLYTASSTSNIAAAKVSLDRPSTNQHGGDYFIRNDIAWIKWSEAQGYDLGYLSDVDIHTTPGILSGHKAFVTPGHAEYWTKAKRDAVEAFRDSGKSCAFLGGNICYWQVRLESGTQNGANRTLVGYKVITGGVGGIGSGAGAPSNDPMYGVDNSQVCTHWRDPIVNRPEASMIGVQYNHATNGVNYPFVPASPATSRYFAGSGLVGGQSYGTDLVGDECDNIQTGSPGNLITLGASPYTTDVPNADTSNFTVYTANSGALVFGAGSICWTWCLDTYRYTPSDTFTTAPVIPGLQVFMNNIMGALKGPVYGNIGH